MVTADLNPEQFDKILKKLLLREAQKVFINYGIFTDQF